MGHKVFIKLCERWHCKTLDVHCSLKKKLTATIAITLSSCQQSFYFLKRNTTQNVFKSYILNSGLLC